jgi:hypothetical protein
MDTFYKYFYRSCYLKTGGFIPTLPSNQNIYPGDFFQIRHGEMFVLGDIFRNGVIDADIGRLGPGVKLNPANWNLTQVA